MKAVVYSVIGGIAAIVAIFALAWWVIGKLLDLSGRIE